jgi:hypothetical protein
VANLRAPSGPVEMTVSAAATSDTVAITTLSAGSANVLPKPNKKANEIRSGRLPLRASE